MNDFKCKFLAISSNKIPRVVGKMGVSYESITKDICTRKSSQ
jgi:hypothetical protein